VAGPGRPPTVGAKAGARVIRFRELNELSRAQLRDLIEQDVGLRVSTDTIGKWERDKGRTPDVVLRYMQGGRQESPLVDEDEQQQLDGMPPRPEDPPPGSFSDGTTDDGPKIKPLQLQSQLYEKACVDLWLMIGFGVQVAGKGLRSPLVERDGAIIQSQASDLGKAYGKLAEQNETFRRIVVGLTQGGVWVEVGGVTISLAMAIAGNHSAYAAHLRQQAQEAANRPPEPPEGDSGPQDGAHRQAPRDGTGPAPHQQAA
jgi:hypothetical protein